MKTYNNPERTEWPDILKRPVLNNRDVDSIVGPVLNNVREKGDEALIKYTLEFDKVELKNLQVSEEEFIEAGQHVDSELKLAIEHASENIRVFHTAQQLKTEKIETSPGVICWQKPVAIEKVGLYIPGGSAPLFSTVLMLVIPARIAGCTEIILCTPPGKDGKIHPAVLYAAKINGITRVFKIGGAQAVAAMAFGTETIPKVHKIFGPGNQYVTAAKQMVSRGDVAIDMPAGPSELAVIADESAHIEYVAADLLSQAEHGTDSQVLLFTTSKKIADRLPEEVNRQLKHLPRKNIAQVSLENSRIIMMKEAGVLMDMVNEYAPEHLIIASDNPDVFAEKIINAGSVFIGHFTPESAGDYMSGTNHTLPTNGYAKAYSGVNIDSFIRKITFQQISKQGIANIGRDIMKMAAAEELDAHKNAVAIRLF